MRDDITAPSAKPDWLVASEKFLQDAKEAPDKSPPSSATTVADWFKEPHDQLDPLDPRRSLRAAHVTSMIARFHNHAPHGGSALWEAMLKEALKAEPYKSLPGTTSPEVERERLRKMTAPQRLAESNKFGGGK